MLTAATDECYKAQLPGMLREAIASGNNTKTPCWIWNARRAGKP